MTTVLVTGVGGLASQNIIRCAKQAGHKVIGTDVNALAAGLYRSDKGYLVSRSWNQYIEDLQRICRKEHVEVLVPGSDVELPILSKNEHLFDEMGVCVIIGTHESIMIARDKFETQEFLRRKGFPFIRSYLPEDLDKCIDEVGFPFVIKPRSGYGAAHFYVVKNTEEARVLISYIRRDGWEPLLQEYIQTDSEYTTGVHIARDGDILGSVSAWRRLKRGITVEAIIDDFPQVREHSEKVAVSLETKGPLNFQSKFTNGKCLIFEINARFSGTTSIRSTAGVNGVEVLIRNFLYGEKIRLEPKKIVTTLYSEYLSLSAEEYSRLLWARETEKCGRICESWW
jgi:carbamoyl-phosphate synthase large subunit